MYRFWRWRRSFWSHHSYRWSWYFYCRNQRNIAYHKGNWCYMSKWDCYMSECSALLFVIDASDLGPVASDLVLLHEILSNRPPLFKKPFAILFNKTDLVEDPSSIATIYNVLHVEEIQNENRDFLDIILLSGSSIAKDSSSFCVRAWLQSSLLLWCLRVLAAWATV